MEFRLYWNIILKRLWLIVAIVTLLLVSYLATAPRPATGYIASMRFVVGLQPEQSGGQYYTYDYYYTWLTAEYLADDFSEVVKSRAFAGDVAATAGIDIPAGAIQGATSAGKLHRILTVTVSWPRADELDKISQGIAQVLKQHANTYFQQLGTDTAVISLIDPPAVSAVGPSLRQKLDLPLRVLLGLILGVGLTFFLDYIDPTIRNRHDARELGLSLLGEIPTHGRVFGWLGRRRP